MCFARRRSHWLAPARFRHRPVPFARGTMKRGLAYRVLRVEVRAGLRGLYECRHHCVAPFQLPARRRALSSSLMSGPVWCGRCRHPTASQREGETEKRKRKALEYNKIRTLNFVRDLCTRSPSIRCLSNPLKCSWAMQPHQDTSRSCAVLCVLFCLQPTLVMRLVVDWVRSSGPHVLSDRRQTTIVNVVMDTLAHA